MTEISETSIEDYLTNSGGIGLILRLNESKGKIVRALKSEMGPASATVTDRIEEAKDLELVALSPNPADHGNANRYKLTERGAALKSRLESEGVADKYWEYIKAKQSYDEARDKLAPQLTTADFMHPKWPPDRDDPRAP